MMPVVMDVEPDVAPCTFRISKADFDYCDTELAANPSLDAVDAPAIGTAGRRNRRTPSVPAGSGSGSVTSVANPPVAAVAAVAPSRKKRQGRKGAVTPSAPSSSPREPAVSADDAVGVGEAVIVPVIRGPNKRQAYSFRFLA